MAVKKITYFKEYTSITKKQNGEEYQEISDEDSKIREDIKNEFSRKSHGNYSEGSDSKFSYGFMFRGRPQTDSENCGNVQYRTIIDFSKSGDKRDLKKLSDLEKKAIRVYHFKEYTQEDFKKEIQQIRKIVDEKEACRIGGCNTYKE